MKKYMTGPTRFLKAKIDAVEVSRESEYFVWIDGRRNAKTSDWTNYHDTWEDAHAFLLGLATSEVAHARRDLELANAKLGNVKGMKKPEES